MSARNRRLCTAFLAACSESNAEMDAQKAKKHLDSLFRKQDDNVMPKTEAILRMIQEGKADSIIKKAELSGVFDASHAVFETLVDEVVDHLKRLESTYGSKLPIKIKYGKRISASTDEVQKLSTQNRNVSAHVLTIECGDSAEGHFQITVGYTFYIPGTKFFPFPPPHLNETFYPYVLNVALNSNRRAFSQKKSARFSLTMKRNGQTFMTGTGIVAPQAVNVETINDKLTQWVTDDEGWRLIQ